MDKIRDKVDLFLYDLKMMDDKKHQEYTGGSNGLILKNLKFLATTGKKIIIRIPMIADINDTEENIGQTIAFLKSLGNISDISILPYHLLGSQKYKKLKRPDPAEKFRVPTDEKIQEIKKKFEDFGFRVKIGA